MSDFALDRVKGRPARRPTRADLHRLVAVDTRITVAIAELSVGARISPADLASLGITDLGEIVSRLEAHLATIRARVSTMFENPYPQQP
jgi:hypothetical protein